MTGLVPVIHAGDLDKVDRHGILSVSAYGVKPGHDGGECEWRKLIGACAGPPYERIVYPVGAHAGDHLGRARL